MKKHIVAVSDKKSTFLQPVCTGSLGEAERGFGDEVNNPQSLMSKHPGDYALYLIGTFDPESGVIVPEPKPKFLAEAMNYAKLKNQEVPF